MIIALATTLNKFIIYLCRITR